MKIIFFIHLFCLLFTVTICAQSIDYKKYGVNSAGHIPKGLNVNSKAPNFKGYDQYGNHIELDSLIKNQQVVIVFYRGVWCPVCVRYLNNLQDSLYVLQKKGVKVIAVTPEIQSSIDKTISKTNAEFTIVSDTNDSIMKAYDVYFEVTKYYQKKVVVGRWRSVKGNNSQQEAILPVPATYIINKKGVITYKYFDLNYKNRASVKDILEHL